MFAPTKVFTALFAASLLTAAHAATFIVAVGGNGTLTYNPPVVNASVGDQISFQFKAKNHTVTQSTFANPCTRMATPALGVDSGFMPVPANASLIPQWTITINNASAPLWFYCRQTGHCGKGMVFAVNPTPLKSFAAFQAAALATANSTSTTGAASMPPATASTGGAAGAGTGTNAAAAATGTARTSGARPLGVGAAGVLAAVGLAAGVLL